MSARPRPERHAEQGAGALSGRAGDPGGRPRLLSLDNIVELSTLAEASERKLEFILAVPARRYAELGGTLEAMDFSWGWPRAVSCRAAPGGRPRSRFARPSSRRDAETIEELEVFAEELVAKLDAQDEGKSEARPPRH